MPIIKSIFLLTLISTIVALPISHSFVNFAEWFATALIAQIICHNIYIRFVNLQIQRDAKAFELAKIAEYSKQGIEVTCPCAKAAKAFIPIHLDKNNNYKCLECNRSVSVDIQVKTINTTEIVDIDVHNELEKAAIHAGSN